MPLRSAVRSQLMALSLLAFLARPGAAQLVGPWSGWNYSTPNMVAVGYGANAGIVGGRYAHALGPSPWALGVGAGRYGVTPYIELGLESRWLRGLQNYVSVGVLLGWAPGNRGSGALALDAGVRMWFANDHVFLDAGLGLTPTLWGRTVWQFWGMVVPHAQLGVAF